MAGTGPVRLDKWLWAVRLYKSRSVASEACQEGHVTIAGLPAKASRNVQVGDTIRAKTGDLTRTVRVTALLEKRVGAKLVSQYLEDLTPPEERQKPAEKNFLPVPFRPKGSGRPTKKERRTLDKFF